MDSQADKYKRGFLVSISIVLLFCLLSCSPQKQDGKLERGLENGRNGGMQEALQRTPCLGLQEAYMVMMQGAMHRFR